MTEDPPKSPLVTEAAMFRVVVGVGRGDRAGVHRQPGRGPEWAAILLGFEIGIAIGVFWRRRRLRASG